MRAARRGRIEGVISASTSRHAISNHVTNTARPAINNGVIVKLGAGSVWTVAGTSCLTKLVVDADATVQAPPGKSLSLAVDGTATALTPGSSHSGALVLTVA
ncbi:hypothetical protein ACFY1L_04580 [Streptomyces sp. NPDC001663]|uniref:hypothetical protein n=1 Tax=Streptomyces sp. NPDC001663 TaxID=3364597 RepID=UPI0036CD7EDE